MFAKIKPFKNIAFLIVGSLLYAVGIACFLDPNQLAPGGVVGISIILNHLTQIPTGTVILMLNIPLMLLAWWKFGFRMICSTMFVTFFSSYVIDYLTKFGALTNDLFISACFGNALVAVGMVMIFKVGSTSGGTDILVKLIKIKYRHASTGSLFLLTDAVVVTAAILIFGDLILGLYAVLAMVVFSVVFDKLMYGTDSAKVMHVISEKHHEIGQQLMDQLEVGVTYLNASGGFTGADKQVIICAMKKRLLPQAQDIIKDVDPLAFVIISSATEVFGEGHKDHYYVRM